MKTSEVLNNAADDLQVNGWRQKSAGMEPSGPHCALGAISAVVGIAAPWGHYDFVEAAGTRAAVALASHLGVHVGHEGEGVYLWNDADDRTADEVIATLRATAVIEAARETADERTEAHA